MEILENADKYKEEKKKENTKNSEKHLAHDWHIGFFFFNLYLFGCFTVARKIFFGTCRVSNCGAWWRGLWSVEAQKFRRAGLIAETWDLSFPTRERTRVPCIARQILNHWTTREVPVSVFLTTPAWLSGCPVSASFWKRVNVTSHDSSLSLRKS